MFVLAVIFLPDKPEYMVGLIIIGLARCIAMVIVWNDLALRRPRVRGWARGVQLDLPDPVLLGLRVVLHHLAASSARARRHAVVDITIGEIAKSVAIYLGIPFAAGFLTRWTRPDQDQGTRMVRQSFAPTNRADHAWSPYSSPSSSCSRLKGDTIVALPLRRGAHRRPAVDLLRADVLRISFWLSKLAGADYEVATTLSFTAASNNFELAIAVAVATFGIHHGAAFAAVIGPLVEVPVMIGTRRTSRSGFATDTSRRKPCYKRSRMSEQAKPRLPSSRARAVASAKESPLALGASGRDGLRDRPEQ